MVRLSGGGVRAGDNIENAVQVPVETYVENHCARFAMVPAALVRIPQVNGLVYAVSNGQEEVTGIYEDGMNFYTAMTGDMLRVYFTLRSGCTYATQPKPNPMVIPVSDWTVTVDSLELPTVNLAPVSYLDWNGEKIVEKVATDYEYYYGDFMLAGDKTYVVCEDMVINLRIKVNGTAEHPTRLILCDGVTLTAAKGVEVSLGEDGAITNALIICGQTQGGGTLIATGDDDSAGIGGGPDGGDAGMVTINGGIVMAMAGVEAAGIGGGYYGNGGTVTINGGAVTAIGADGGAGIGGGWSGAGGTVTINGGTVTASGGESGAGIGGGAYSEDAGMVTFGVSFEGGVLAGADVTHASVLTTDEFVQDHSAAYVTMPVAALRIPQIAGVTYVVSNGTDEIEGVRMNGTNTYRVAIGDSLKLYFVRDPDCTYVQEPKANPKILGEVTGVMTIGLEDLPTVRVPPIAYLDWDDGKLVEKATTDYLEYRGDVALAGGVTYVVRKDMSVGFRFRVNGTVDNPTRLILCDGATLLATQGVEVSVDEDNAITHALIICGQTQGSGTLIATGSEDSAGIGGGINGAGGAVTINGGTVFACADTESGGDDGAGIGGGIFGAGGSVTINGGTVTATGGENGAGIGGGYNCAGGTVMITGGKVAACGGKSGEDIGHGRGSEDSGTVMVSGGLFWEGLKDEWIAKGYTKFANDDTKTKDQYPWMVLHRVKITLPTDVPECSYVVSNLTTGAEIEPSGGQEGGATYLLPVGDHVAIFCVPSEGYMVIGTNPHDIPEVTAETTVVVENLPTVLPARTAEFFLGEGIASVTFTTEPAVTSGVATVDFTLSPIPQGTKINIEVICADGYDEYVGTNEFVVGEEDICVALETSLPAVEYCDAQGRRLEAEHVVVLNARAGGVLGDGKWYLITGTNEVNRTLSVRGEVNLILVDGAKLTVVGEEQQAGVAVTSGNSLTIWGQSLGTGELVARGGYEGAGIGGGLYGSGGTVTINGGIITAQGNSFSAGIGGGDWGSGGTVTINGGQVTAKGGWWGAGIGGGLFGAGKEVLITGGKVIAHGNDGGEDIGHGYDAEDSGTIVISGGVFGMTIPSGWCAPNYFAVENTNPETRGSYPWAVASMSVVTVGNHPHTTAAYTYGDGSKTNVIGEDSFEIPLGTFGVQVIFTLEHHYRFVDVHETGIRALDSPLMKDAYEVVPPEVEGIPGTVVNPWSVGETVTAYVSDEGVLIIGGTGEMDDFASEDEAPWAAVVGAIKEVTVAAGVTKVGKNALAKVGDAIKVDGTPLSTYRTVTDHTTTINGISLDEYNAAVRRLNVGEEWKAGPASELVVPDGMVLVTKESIQAAQAMTVEIVDGQVELGVSVLSNADFTVSTADWAPVKFSSDTKIDFSADGTKLILSIPVSAPQGFMILQSGDAKIGQ